MKSRYTWLLFDADGTLLDYKAAEHQALAAAVESFGLKITDQIRKDYQEINSRLWAMLEKGEIGSEELREKRFEVLAKNYGWNIDAGDFSRRYLDRLSNCGHMISGARKMLENLPDHINKAIITNGIRDTQFGRLADAGIRDMFAEVVVSEDAGAAKPAARFFDYMIERIGCSNRETMMVIGDSLSSDIAGGNGYGIDTCWYNPAGYENTTGIQPCYQIKDWRELYDILNLRA